MTAGADDDARPGDGHGVAPRGRSADGPVFDEPWQAQAFALVVHLQERRSIGRDEWAARLGAALREQDPAADGRDYYRRWLAALERVLLERGVVAPGEVDALAAAWRRAARATPHGRPVELSNDPG